MADGGVVKKLGRSCTVIPLLPSQQSLRPYGPAPFAQGSLMQAFSLPPSDEGGVKTSVLTEGEIHTKNALRLSLPQSTSLTAEGELPRRGKRGCPGVPSSEGALGIRRDLPSHKPALCKWGRHGAAVTEGL